MQSVVSQELYVGAEGAGTGGGVCGAGTGVGLQASHEKNCSYESILPSDPFPVSIEYS